MPSSEAVTSLGGRRGRKGWGGVGGVQLPPVEGHDRELPPLLDGGWGGGGGEEKGGGGVYTPCGSVSRRGDK